MDCIRCFCLVHRFGQPTASRDEIVGALAGRNLYDFTSTASTQTQNDSDKIASLLNKRFQLLDNFGFER
jgi:hypothetical protein